MNRSGSFDNLEIITSATYRFLAGGGVRLLSIDNNGLVSATTAGAGDVTLVGVQTLTNKTLSTGTKINLGTVAAGDQYYGDGTGTLIRVGAGINGQVWTMVSGVPAWADPTGGGGGSSFFSAVDFAGTGTSLDPIRLANGNGFQDPGANGWLARTGANTVTQRTFTAGSSGNISITNTTGAGNPVWDLAGAALAVVNGTGVFKQNFVRVTTQNFTVGASDVNIIYDFVGGGGTVTLPTISSTSDKRVLWIKNSTAGNLTTSVAIWSNSSTSTSTINPSSTVKLVIDNGGSKIWQITS